MSNFKCSECGMINVDCGKEGYKTPREIELEKENETLKSLNKHLTENGLFSQRHFKEENEKYKSFLEWMLKQQYYILPANIKKKIKEVLNDNNINLN